MGLTRQFKGQTKNVFEDVDVVDLMVGQRKLLMDYAIHVKSATLMKKSDIVHFFWNNRVLCPGIDKWFFAK